MKKIGLYFHIPFCQKKCYYCDFLSFVGREELFSRYISYMILELDLYREILAEYTISTIFIGGGTPSLIDGGEILRLMDYIRNNFYLDLDEVTIELNPGSLTREKAGLYKEAGIDRISIGLQTFNDDLLKRIGRTHQSEDFFKSYETLRKEGFENISADLIFGFPGQTMKDIEHDLKEITSLDLKHISYYGLILEEGTPFYKAYEEGNLDLPSEEEERDFYHRIRSFLKEEGYKHYEISNYAKAGYESKHNMTYWKIEPYIGIGMGSHSNFQGQRYWNASSFDQYFHLIEKGELPIVGSEDISRMEEISEYSLMGIRLLEGISKKAFKERFDQDIEEIYPDVLAKHEKNGLLINKDYIRLTDLGLDLANLVEVDFLL